MDKKLQNPSDEAIVTAALTRLTDAERRLLDVTLAKVRQRPNGSPDYSALSKAEIDELDRLFAGMGGERRVGPPVAPPTLPPHEQRAARHRARYHGEDVPLPDWSVTARSKQLDRFGLHVRMICGYGAPCASSLGEATRPDRINVHEPGYALELLELETYGPREGDSPDPGSWVLTAPTEFPGFERMEDGSFAVIKTKKVRAPDGSLVRRRTGRREAPNVLYSAYMSLRENLDGVAGWPARLPAVVACPLCGRYNLVEEPTGN